VEVKRAALAPTTAIPKRERKRQAAVVAGAQRPVIERHYQQRVGHIDTWSVLKMAVCFYLSALIVMLSAGMLLWYVADTAGLIHNFETFVGDLLDDKNFHFLSLEILRAATLIGLVLVCLMTILTVLAAAFYNLFSELVGGVEITVVEEA
jgi:hypothetical protein